MRLLLLGAPDWGRDCWHDDLADDAGRVLGWRVDYLAVKDAPVDDIVRAARGADLLIWARTHDHNPDGDAAGMLRRIEDAGTATVGLHLDMYWGMPVRERQIGRRAWWTCQYVYTTDGGPRPWHTRGVNHHWCPQAVGSRRLGRAEPAGSARFMFAGSLHTAHTAHRPQMVAWARQHWGDEFVHYNEFAGTGIYGDDLSRAVSYAHCVLGDSVPAAGYWSDRGVRVMARGGIFAHPRFAGMAEQGLTDDTMVAFNRYDFQRLGQRVDAMTGPERESMREAAMAVVADRHLWRHRLETIAREVLG
jgi:hypothetical protein